MIWIYSLVKPKYLNGVGVDDSQNLFRGLNFPPGNINYTPDPHHPHSLIVQFIFWFPYPNFKWINVIFIKKKRNISIFHFIGWFFSTYKFDLLKHLTKEPYNTVFFFFTRFLISINIKIAVFESCDTGKPLRFVITPLSLLRQSWCLAPMWQNRFLSLSSSRDVKYRYLLGGN